MGEQLSLLKRSPCIFCFDPHRYLDEPHAGPCGKPCFGGVRIEDVPKDSDAFLSAHHADPCACGMKGYERYIGGSHAAA